MLLKKTLSIVALVGDNMKNHPGISGKMFGVLGRNGVNVRAIAQGSSERNISAVIATGDVKKAINVLHEEFFETTYKQVNLFIAERVMWAVNYLLNCSNRNNIYKINFDYR